MIMGTQTTKGRSMRLEYPTLHLSNTMQSLQLAPHRPAAVIVQTFLKTNFHTSAYFIAHKQTQ